MAAAISAPEEPSALQGAMTLKDMVAKRLATVRPVGMPTTASAVAAAGTTMLQAARVAMEDLERRETAMAASADATMTTNRDVLVVQNSQWIQIIRLRKTVPQHVLHSRMQYDSKLCVQFVKVMDCLAAEGTDNG